LDLLFGVFVIAGIEKVTATPGIAPNFRLDDIAWSHSLAAALAWSVVYALFFLRQGKAVALTLGIAVLVAACGAYYASRAKADGTFGKRYPLMLAALLVLHLGNSPWFSLLMMR
ncbi:MAG: hypothetical protein ABIP89_14595, partial [Polyangiaceae bacterium]